MSVAETAAISARTGRAIERLAVRGSAQDRRAAEEEAEGRGDLRDRLRPVRPAAYRHLRRGRAHHHGAPRLPRAHRRQDQDAADRVLRRHGRPAQGAGQRAEQGVAGEASRQAADQGARSVRHASRASASTTMRGCAPSSITSASTTNSCRRPNATSPAASTQALLKVLERFDEVMAIMLPSLREERAATYSPFLPIDPKTGIVLQVPVTGARRQGRHHHLRRPRHQGSRSPRRSPAGAASCNGSRTGRCAGSRSASTTRWPART